MNIDNKIALSAYYKGKGLSNADIALLLRVDASSVSRYLKQAEENKWLRQKVLLSLPRELDRSVQATVRDVGLEEDLFQFFSAKASQGASTSRIRREGFVVVRPPRRSDAGARTHTGVLHELCMAMMGIEGGRLLVDLLLQGERDQPTTLGVTWGRSTGRVVSCLGEMSLPELPNLVVVALQGGVGRSLSSDAGSQYYPDILAERLSLLFGSRSAPIRITLPAYISAVTAAEVKEEGLKAIWKFIEGDYSFQQAALHYKRLDLALIGLGGFERQAWARSSSYLADANSVAALIEEGAVGDIACRFFRGHSEPPIEGWDERSGETEAIRRTNLRAIGISLASLHARVRAGARVIAVAGGHSGAKAGAIRAGMLGGLVTEIVTDEDTAVSILKDGCRRAPSRRSGRESASRP
jgi:DNA-binding transcriptional regulator LsrR (DeoR family)